MEKLYEWDAYLKSFSALVESCIPGKHNTWDVILDQTAFYPEGGGQPWDTGTLQDVNVLEVHKRGDRVVHICDGPLKPNTKILGEIDWDRRFDLMQQHSGEHIVSGLAHSFWGCDNVGFHLGKRVVTIDFNINLDAEQLHRLEIAANDYIWQDHPTLIFCPSSDELDQIEYRSKKSLSGQVRIVSFPGADTCACCGTHVASSGQIGLVKLLSAQTFRSGTRIELMCGKRAFSCLNAVFEQNRQISNLLSAKPLRTAEAVSHVLEEQETLKSRYAALREQQFAAIAEEYRNTGNVLLFQPDLPPIELRKLCDAILHTCGGWCACFSGRDGDGYQYAMGCLDQDLHEFVTSLHRTLQGRGGGRSGFIQGSVQANRTEIETFFESVNVS